MLSLDQEGMRLLENIQKLELQRDELLNEKLYLHRYKENRVDHDSGKIMEIPAFIGINHPELNQISNELIELNTNIDSYKNSLSSANPIAIDLTQRYSRLNELLNKSLDNAIELNSVLFDSLDARMSNVLNEFASYPKAEQQLLYYRGKQLLVTERLESLLQRKAGAQVMKASNLPDTAIIDLASNRDLVPISPNRPTIYIIALLLGFALPISCIVILETINDNIISLETLQQHTKLPNLGIIPHAKESTELSCFV